MKENWEFATRSIHSGVGPETKLGATTPPIYQSSAFGYDTAEELSDVFQGRGFGYIYSRVANPTVSVIEQRVNALEQGRGALAAASGMAAIATTIFALTRSGDEIIAGKSLFGGTLQLFSDIFENYGVQVVYVDSCDVAGYRKAISSRTRLIFLETIGNPQLDVPDLKQIATVAAEYEIPLVVDSTLTTPYLLFAKEFGVNIVIHSTSKYISGSGNSIGGVLVDLGNFEWKRSRSEAVRELSAKVGGFAFLARARKQIQQNTGSCLSPFNAYLQCLGLETLALRMERHCDNALALAKYLQNSPQIVSVNYPGLDNAAGYQVAKTQFGGRFGGILTIRLGTQERAFKLVNRLKMVKNLANIGDAKTLIIHPASTIYCNCSRELQEAAGVYPDLLRISVGIEAIKDIIADFEAALKEV